jgi:nitrogen fixation protein FixH
MKAFNWGHKIALLYTAFVVGMLFMAYKSSQQKFDLVQTDYYAAELKYQEVIDASERSKALGGNLIVKFEKDSVKVLLPVLFNGLKVKGKLHLYYPADQQQDRHFDFETVNGAVAFKSLGQKKGYYKVKLDLLQSGIAYYYEQKIEL